MKLEQFAMERMQSTYENLVEFNLSESGVRPLTPRELIADATGCDGLLDQPLVYSQSNGTIELRQAIAEMYPGAGVDHIEVTNGGSEANFITIFNLIEPGDEVVMLVPNYMQTWGLSRAFGGTIREWRLAEDRAAGRWRADIHELERLVSPRTKMIVICNPNNPTGARLTPADLDAIARVADQHGAWILSDEVYRGAEIDGIETASMWGRSPKAIVTSGLSKAYGLPGLRIGWIVGQPSLIASLWSYHDYVTIAPGALSDRLARIALKPERRAQLFERTRQILRGNLPLIEAWLTEAGGFSWITAGSRRDHLCALRPRHQFDDAGESFTRGKERVDRARRSLRHGRLPAARLRRATRVQPRRPRSTEGVPGVATGACSPASLASRSQLTGASPASPA